MVAGTQVGELAEATETANGRATSIQWRPWLDTQLEPDSGRIFPDVARYGSTHEGRIIEEYSCILEPASGATPA